MVKAGLASNGMSWTIYDRKKRTPRYDRWLPTPLPVTVLLLQSG